MPKTINIDVTESDIRAGVTGSCQFCPIARAAKRTFNTSRVHVTDTVLEFGLPDPLYPDTARWHTVELPDEAQGFVKAFDANAGGTPRPIAFPVDLDLDAMHPDDAAHFA